MMGVIVTRRAYQNRISLTGAQSSGISMTLVDSTSGFDTGGTMTIAGVNFGAAASGRVIVVAGAFFSGDASKNISSATIGGISAIYSGYNNAWDAYILSAVVPTGTSGDIVLTMNNSNPGNMFSNVEVYSLIGANGATAYNTGSDSGHDALSYSVDVQDGGVIIGSAMCDGESRYTWTGLTEDFDAVLSSDKGSTMASKSYVAGTTQAITATASGTFVNKGVARSWSPA